MAGAFCGQITGPGTQPSDAVIAKLSPRHVWTRQAAYDAQKRAGLIDDDTIVHIVPDGQVPYRYAHREMYGTDLRREPYDPTPFVQAALNSTNEQEDQ